MPKRSVSPVKTFGPLLATLTLFGFTGCVHEISSRSVPISAGAMHALQAPNATVKAGTYHQEGNAFAFKVGWEAPASVSAPLRFWNGLPHMQARVNGKDVWMVPDTGSQICVLEAATALRCNVRTIPPAQAKVQVLGTSGIESALAGVPEEMSVGKWTWQNLPCVVRTHSNPGAPRRMFSNNEPFNIFGMAPIVAMASYVTFDYKNSRITFGFRDPYTPGPRNTWSGVNTASGLPLLTAASAGRNWRALLDTGSAAPVELSMDDQARLKIPGRPLPIQAYQLGLGGSQNRSGLLPVLAIYRLSVGGRVFPTAEAFIVPDQSKIGGGLMKDLRFTLDLKRQRLWLE